MCSVDMLLFNQNCCWTDERSYEMLQVVEYLKVVRNLESILDEGHISKINKRLRENVKSLQAVCKEIAHFILAHWHTLLRNGGSTVGTDSYNKLDDYGGICRGSYEQDTWTYHYMGRQCFWHRTQRGRGWQFHGKPHWSSLNSSHSLPINGTQVCLDKRDCEQLLGMLKQKYFVSFRFLIARDTMILQYLLIAFFSKQNEKVFSSLPPGKIKKKQKIFVQLTTPFLNS